MRILAVVLVIVLAAAGAAYWYASRAEGPVVQILQPTKLLGQDGTLEVTIEAPSGHLKSIDIRLEQNGKSMPLYSMTTPGDAIVKQETPERMRLTRPIGKRALPDLQAGAAKITVTAGRAAFLNLRTPSTTVTRDVQVRLTPPQVSIVSTHHYINHGGAEMVVYRVSPPDVESGVRVGDLHFRGYPGTAVGLADPALRVAFFALSYDQDLTTPMALFARDEAGNEAQGRFDYKVFQKPQKRSKIELNDAFLQRVVPDILAHTSDFKAPGDDRLAAFLKLNGDLRRVNADKMIALAKESAPEMLWKGPFRPLGNAQVESKFADHRTYYYQGKEVDQQVHLGFDLAVTANVPVLAGNSGNVVYADYFGIYGNCVIIDHGLGVQSLYGHLSSISVKKGDKVEKNQLLGKSGMTGLAAGDHLHFGVMVGGYPVNPVEWWDPHWIQDRVLRKITEAGAPTSHVEQAASDAATKAAPKTARPAKKAAAAKKHTVVKKKK